MHLIDWNSVSCSFDKEGLGIIDLSAMNVAFIFKWFYQYANERDCLQRKVVCAKSGANSSLKLSPISSSSRKSTLSNLLGSFLNRHQVSSNLISTSSRTLIGDGSNTSFWMDNWTNIGGLSYIFPRIFALALVKFGPITNFDYWD